jgi:transposase
MQPMLGVDERRRATTRLIELAAQRALRRPFWLVACETGLSARAVRAAFSEEVHRLECLASCEAPRVLGFDVVHVGRRNRLLLIDVEARRVINLAASVDQPGISQALFGLRNRWRVETVMLPFSCPVRQVVREMLPQARVIVDRFLVMSLAHEAIDAVRKNHHSSRCPVSRCELEAAYVLKAQFMAVWRSRSSDAARRRYSEWVLSVPPELGYAFGPVMRTVENWSDEIFGYFDRHAAGAYSQMVTHRVRDLQRSGQCRDFPTARAKIIYGSARARG